MPNSARDDDTVPPLATNGNVLLAFRWCRRNSIVAASIAVAIIAVVLGTSLAAYLVIEANLRATEALAGKIKADKQVEEALAGSAIAKEAQQEVGRKIKEALVP